MKPITIDYKKRICSAMNYISQNIDRELSLDEIANAASFSAYHFHRIFSAAVGETVATYCRRIRLESAANKLISNTTDDITTIAMEFGYSSSQNFAKAFKKHFKMTPTDYRLMGKSKIGNAVNKNENAFMFQTVYDPDSISNNLIKPKTNTTMNTEIKELPELQVAYIRKIGAYDKENCGQAFMELAQYAGPRNLLGPEKMLAIYWDNPEVTPPEKCRFDACVIVPDDTAPQGQVCIQSIRGGSYAVHHAEVKQDQFQEAWQNAFVWLCNSGLEASDGPCYELYHNNGMEHPEGLWKIDICIPLKQA